MAELNEDRERHIVPRWRDFARTAETGELDSLTPNTSIPFQQRDLQYVLNEFQDNPSLSSACEAVSIAYSVGQRELAKEAAQAVLAHPAPPPLAVELASRCLSQTVSKANTEFEAAYSFREAKLDELIRSAKSRLQTQPRNAILWTNLSLFYTIRGQKSPAEQAMRVASILASDNRFVVRAASRLYLHHEDPERARQTLLQSKLITSDPWVMAAEIAVSGAGKRSSACMKSGIKILESGCHSAFHISELAGAIATIEATHGNMRKARRYCTVSLKAPSENSVAQAAWLERNIGGFLIHDPSSYDQSHEAKAWHSQSQSNWERAYQSAVAWQAEQPFSSRPAIFAGYVASTALEDYGMAAKCLSIGYACNRNDATLLNNLAFALANQDNLVRATQLLDEADRLQVSRRQRLVLTATRGLIAFRLGNPTAGRVLYQLAINSCGSDEQQLAAVASFYLAMEELRQNSPEAKEMIQIASRKLELLREPYKSMFQNKLKAKSQLIISR